jgi:hypothetical protein
VRFTSSIIAKSWPLALEGGEAGPLTRGEAGVRHRVHDERAPRHPQDAAHLRVEVDRLVHRHLLGQGDDGEGGARGIDEERLHPLGVVPERAPRDGVDQRRGDAQELHGVAGGGGVHHHEVPARPASLLRLRLVEDLPQHHQLGEGRHHPQEVADEPVLEDRVVDGPEAQHHEPVLAHGVGGRHVDGEEAGEDLADRAAGGRAAEERRDPFLRVHLADEHPLPRAGGEEGERGRDGRLPHAALPGHDHETAIEKGRAGHQA